MSERVELACTVCTEEFVVPIEAYKAHCSVVLCPCCGSTDLVLLGVEPALPEKAPIGA
jgi:hypothetical protein